MLNLSTGRDGPEKEHKQGKDERTLEDYPTSAAYFLRYRVVF